MFSQPGGQGRRTREDRWRKEREGHRRKPEEHRNFSSVNNFSTFFFSNFPGGFGEYDMLKIFQKWAKVKEVFISKRLNRWGRRFGFVRLFDVENVFRMEKQLDQIYIGNMKLYENIPKYRRGVSSQLGGESVRPREVKKLCNHEPVKPKSKEVWREKTGKSIKRGHSESRSYADAVRNTSHERWKGPVFEAKSQVLPWMSNSAVGWMSEDMNFDLLCEELIKGGMSMVKARFMGDNMVLLTPKEDFHMEDFVKLNKDWVVSAFKDVEPWYEACVADHRLVRVRCYGLPIPLWTKECLTKVVGEVATVVAIDDATLSWENLDFSRFQVRKPVFCEVGGLKTFRINGQVFNISLVEEEPMEGVGVCNCTMNHSDSLDSFYSMGSFVEETIFSSKFGDEGGENGDEDGGLR